MRRAGARCQGGHSAGSNSSWRRVLLLELGASLRKWSILLAPCVATAAPVSPELVSAGRVYQACQ